MLTLAQSQLSCMFLHTSLSLRNNDIHITTDSVVNPRRACAVRVTVLGRVCVCVCISVKSHLTSGASVRPENTVMYSVGNGGQKICGVFFETAPFKSYGVKRKQYAN